MPVQLERADVLPPFGHQIELIGIGRLEKEIIRKKESEIKNAHRFMIVSSYF